MSDHAHEFPPDEWPFSYPVDTAAFTSVKVAHEGAPILVGCRDHEGDWQFLHGEIDEDDEIAVVCLGCLYEDDRTLGELADLTPGWIATRDRVGGDWILEELEADEEE